MAMQQYIERGRNILANAKALAADDEVYRVTSVRVWHPRPPGDPHPVWQCVRCLKAIEDGDTYRLIVTRLKGSRYAGRTDWSVHNKCFVGANVRGVQ